MNSWTLSAVLAADVCLLLWNISRLKKNQRSLTHGTFLDVLMFPDTGSRQLKRSTFHDGSIVKLVQFLLSAEASIDVCIFNITFTELVKVLIDIRSREIKIRVITDANEITKSGVPQMLVHGIPIRIEKDRNHSMNHKFVIVDNETVATGSLDWSQNGPLENYSNVLITNHKMSVHTYLKEFAKLWSEFHPVENVIKL